MVYSQFLNTTIEKIYGQIEALRNQLVLSTKPHSRALLEQGLPAILRIRTWSGFFGLQKVTDLAYWLDRFIKNSPDARLLHSEFREVLGTIFMAMDEVLQTVEDPLSYGEFVKATGVVVRPLFSREVDLTVLWDRLKQWYPLDWKDRTIYRLPVAYGETQGYSLKVPSRFIEDNYNFHGYLSIVYLDLGRQKNLPWEKLGNDIMEWTQQGAFLYQGALEMPWDKVSRQTSLVPYYLLLKSHQSPHDFFTTLGLNAHIMQILKEPGTDLIPPLEIIEAEELDGFMEEQALEPVVVSAGLLAKSLSSREVLSKAPVDEPVERQNPPVVLAKPKPEPKLPETAATYQPEFKPALGKTIPPPSVDDFSLPDFDLPVFDPPTATEPTPELAANWEEPQESISPAAPKVQVEERTLTTIPFTLDSLGDKAFAWPVGIDNIDWQSLYPKKASKTGATAGDDDNSEFDLFSPESDEEEAPSLEAPDRPSRQPLWPGILLVMAVLAGITAGLWYFLPQFGVTLPIIDWASWIPKDFNWPDLKIPEIKWPEFKF